MYSYVQETTRYTYVTGENVELVKLPSKFNMVIGAFGLRIKLRFPEKMYRWLYPNHTPTLG